MNVLKRWELFVLKLTSKKKNPWLMEDPRSIYKNYITLT